MICRGGVAGKEERLDMSERSNDNNKLPLGEKLKRTIIIGAIALALILNSGNAQATDDNVEAGDAGGGYEDISPMAGTDTLSLELEDNDEDLIIDVPGGDGGIQDKEPKTEGEKESEKTETETTQNQPGSTRTGGETNNTGILGAIGGALVIAGIGLKFIKGKRQKS